MLLGRFDLIMISNIVRQDIPTLTGVRGIAAVWVVLLHIGPTAGAILGLPGLGTVPQIKGGYLGVDLFFILSGFIMSHVHGDHFIKYSASEHARFLKLRVSRIYPLHLVCLLSFALMVFVLPGFSDLYRNEPNALVHLAASVLLLQNWGLPWSTLWNLPSWSLSAEWLGYIAFPFVTITLRRWVPRGQEIAFAFLLLASLIAVVFFSGASSLDGPGKTGLLRMATEFTAGCLIYRSTFQSAFSAAQNSTTFWAAIAILALCTSRVELQWGAVFGLALLIRSLAAPCRAGMVIFANPLAIWLGKISFSLYLCHWPLLEIFNRSVRPMITTWTANEQQLVLLGLVCLMFALSALLWQFVEMPSRSYLRRFISKSESDRPLPVSSPKEIVT